MTIRSNSVLVNTLELTYLSVVINNSRKNWATQKRLSLSSIKEKQCCLTIWVILIQPLKSRFAKLGAPCRWSFESGLN